MFKAVKELCSSLIRSSLKSFVVSTLVRKFNVCTSVTSICVEILSKQNIRLQRWKRSDSGSSKEDEWWPEYGILSFAEHVSRKFLTAKFDLVSCKATQPRGKLTTLYLFHSHKKQKDSLEVSLDRVLFALELEFPKILVPRLPQNTSNVNTKCSKKSKQLCTLCD